MKTASSPTGKTLDDFSREHDPTYVVHEATVEYDRLMPGSTTFLVTAAQNATPVHPVWWKVMEQIAGFTGAERMVIPFRYKNPTSSWSGSQKNAEYWAKEAQPYLWNTRYAMNANLVLLADMKIQPTAKDPLTGKEVMTGLSSGIIGHTKIQTRSVATPSGKMAKLMLTSGACTVPNYSDTNAGREGKFHHSLSAVLVETDGKLFWTRRIHFDEKSGSAIDVGTGKRYFADRIEKAPRALAVSKGDVHVRVVDPDVVAGTYGDGGLMDRANPLYDIHHDLLDAQSCNPHDLADPFLQAAKFDAGADNVCDEVNEAISFVRKHASNQRTGRHRKSVIVWSNHDDMLSRWVKRADWKEDPRNSEFYLETALYMRRNAVKTASGMTYPAAFRYWFEKAKVRNARMLQQDESFVLRGVELGMHGHEGPNGARGSIRNLRRVGLRSIIGHSHSLGEDEGCSQNGTMTHLRLGYNTGPSSWLNAHTVLNADGKRQFVVFINSRWCRGAL
jgi:hypothetical protein